jgi:hypothetical protein
MAKHSFADPGGDLRKYFAAIPNIVFTLGLNPYELALYAHFKQAAGDDGGVCWKSRATISRESGMSAGMVTKARVALEKPRPELGGMPLITVTEEPSKTGGHPTCAATITDIWPINMAKFSTSPRDLATSHHDVEAGAPSYGDGQRHHTTLATSPHALKEKPLKKNPEEDKRDVFAKLKTDPLYARLDIDVELAKAQRWAERNHRRVTPRMFTNWLNNALGDLPLNGNGSGKPVHDAAWHAKQADLARRLGREYRPDAS